MTALEASRLSEIYQLIKSNFEMKTGHKVWRALRKEAFSREI